MPSKLFNSNYRGKENFFIVSSCIQSAEHDTLMGVCIFGKELFALIRNG